MENSSMKFKNIKKIYKNIIKVWIDKQWNKKNKNHKKKK